MYRFNAALLSTVFIASSALAHVGEHPSVHDTVASIIENLKLTFSHEKLVDLSVDEVLDTLTEEEKHVLATQYLTFEVSVPVVVSVIHDVRLDDDPFWLRSRGFQPTGLSVTVNRREFDVWQKAFPAGPVGLGVNTLSGAGEHYFVGLRPQEPGADLKITNIYPGHHTLGVLKRGARPYSDEDDTIRELPDALAGDVLLRGADDRAEDAQVINVFRLTPYPATDSPDHVTLTWSDDPKTTQTIQWRTSQRIAEGVVAYMKKSEYNSFRRGKPTEVRAVTKSMESPYLLNDPLINRHTVVLRDLEPATTYVYAVGTGTDAGWTELAEFTTAPDRVEPFNFIYMGDAQNGLERWGSLAQKSHLHRPDAAFYVMAGDLVNRGADRDDWDSFFENARGIFDEKQLIPALGNHEYQGGNADMYIEMFTLPEESPVGEKAYSFEYSNALFVVLDSNLPVETQTDWLDEQLAGSDHTWKFVVYHHPAYSSSPNRNNPDVRSEWGALFDKYHVDLALQGHDHAYLRTYPMNDEQRVDSPAEGTIYIVSVSGTKFYDQGDFDYTEVGFTNISTYQALDIQISGDRLVYRSYDLEGNLRDEFVIEK